MGEVFDMRKQQFVKAIALAAAALRADDLDKARYWLDGAGIVLTAVEQESEQINSAVTDLAGIRRAGF